MRNIGQIAKMAQQMQTQMAQAQEELKQTTLEATAGGGAVRVVITGAQEVRAIEIDPSAIDPEESEMLQDLVVAAVNEGIRMAEELQQSKLGAPGGAEGFDPMSALESLGLGGMGGAQPLAVTMTGPTGRTLVKQLAGSVQVTAPPGLVKVSVLVTRAPAPA